MFLFRNVAHMVVTACGAAVFVAACLLFPHWWVYITAFLIMATSSFAGDIAGSIRSAHRHSVARKAGLPYVCASDLAGDQRPRGRLSIEEFCIERRAAMLSANHRMHEVYPYIEAAVADHEDQHEFVREYVMADEEGKQIQRAFWKALSESSYSRDVAEELVWEYGYAVALKAVELDLPAEYVASLV